MPAELRCTRGHRLPDGWKAKDGCSACESVYKGAWNRMQANKPRGKKRRKG